MGCMDITIKVTLERDDGPRRSVRDVADALADLVSQETVYVEGGREATVYEVIGDVEIVEAKP